MADFSLFLEAEKRGILPPDKAQLLAEARKRGLVQDTSAGPPSASAGPPDALSALPVSSPYSGMVGLGEAGASMASGLAGKVASDVAGLGALPLHALGLIKTDPSTIKENVQRGMTYQPRTQVGKSITEYNPLALIGTGIGWGAGKAREWIEPPPEAAGPGAEARRWAGRGAEEAIMQAPGLLGVKAGKAMEAKIPAKQAELNIASRENSILDATRDRVQAAGLTTPPEGKSWVTGIPGVGKMDRWISSKNAPEFTRLVAKDLGLKEGTPIGSDTLENIRQEAYKPYKAIVQADYGDVPVVKPSAYTSEWEMPPAPTTRKSGLMTHDEFDTKIKTMLEDTETKLKSFRKTNEHLKPVARLLREYQRKEFNPQQALDNIRTLRHDATANFKAADNPKKLATAFTQREIANMLEDVFEKNLERTGQIKLLGDLRKARTMIAKTHDVEYALNESTGQIDANKLRILSDRGRPLSGNLDLIAEYARAFPKGAQKAGELPRLTFFDMIVAGSALASGHPALAASEVGARVGLPWAAQRGMFQKKRPSYQAGTTSAQTLPPLGIAIGSEAQQNQLQPPPQ